MAISAPRAFIWRESFRPTAGFYYHEQDAEWAVISHLGCVLNVCRFQDMACCIGTIFFVEIAFNWIFIFLFYRSSYLPWSKYIYLGIRYLLHGWGEAVRLAFGLYHILMPRQRNRTIEPCQISCDKLRRPPPHSFTCHFFIYMFKHFGGQFNSETDIKNARITSLRNRF